MEMCYDGALVMPSNYALMDEEEMTYVEGGVKCSTVAKIIDAGIVAISIICGVGGGISLVKEILRRNSKGAIMVLTSTALKYAGITLASETISGIYAILTTVSSFTIGNAIAYACDRLDKVHGDGNIKF